MTYRNYIKSKRKALILWSVLSVLLYHFGAMGWFIISNHVNPTGLYLFKSSYPESTVTISQDNLDQIETTFSAENVTPFATVHVLESAQVRAVENDFIRTGVPAMYYSEYTGVIIDVELLHGTVWEAGTTDRVMVIDEEAAFLYFNQSNAVGQSIEIEGEDWEVIGVISTNNDREKAIHSFAQTYGYTPTTRDFDVAIYIPYVFHDYEKFESPTDEITAVIVDGDSFWFSSREEDALFNIVFPLGSAANTVSMNDGFDYTIISIRRSIDVVNMYAYSLFGYIASFFGGFVFLLTGYAFYTYKTYRNVSIRDYVETDEQELLQLCLDSSQKPFVRPIRDILKRYQEHHPATNLLVILNENKMIGCCLVLYSEKDQNAFIWQFVIDKEFQHQGYGTRLLKNVVQKIHKDVNYTITTTTKKDNAIARTFFEKQGFTIFSEEEDEYNYRYKL